MSRKNNLVKILKNTTMLAVLSAAVTTGFSGKLLAAQNTNTGWAAPDWAKPTVMLKFGTAGTGINLEENVHPMVSLGLDVNVIPRIKAKDKVTGNTNYNVRTRPLSIGLLGKVHPFMDNKWVDGLNAAAGVYYIKTTRKLSEVNNGAGYAKITSAPVAPYLGIGYDVSPFASNGITFGVDVGAFYAFKGKVKNFTPVADTNQEAAIKDKYVKSIIWPQVAIKVGYKF